MEREPNIMKDVMIITDRKTCVFADIIQEEQDGEMINITAIITKGNPKNGTANVVDCLRQYNIYGDGISPSKS